LRIGVRRPVPRGPLGSTQADTPAAAHGERRADGSLTASRVTPLPSFARRAAVAQLHRATLGCMSTLTVKQRRFVQKYVESGNGSGSRGGTHGNVREGRQDG
jgi:hypothetical protein